MQRFKQRDNDGRGLGADTLTELRLRAVRAVLEGQSLSQVAQTMGFSRSAVHSWVKTHRDNNGDWGCLEAAKRGGRPKKLGSEERVAAAGVVLNENPTSMGFASPLWTASTVREMIRRRFDVEISRWSVARMLDDLGISPQRPLWRAWQQDPKRVDDWLEEDFPAIRKEAKKAGADIYFGDEAGLRSDHHAGTTWGMKGITPVIKCTGARFGINVISAVSSGGNLRFMLVDGTVKAGEFVEFMKRLIKGAERPVFLIVDGHPTHKSKAARAFVEANSGKIRLFTLPAYSPELNPDELVWNQLKNHVIGKRVFRDKEELRRETVKALLSMQKRPALIRSFYLHPDTAYAA